MNPSQGINENEGPHNEDLKDKTSRTSQSTFHEAPHVRSRDPTASFDLGAHEISLEKLLENISSPEEFFSETASSVLNGKTISRPGFSLVLLSTNFRRFNARIGVVFAFQKKLKKLLTWKSYSQTISLLAIYTLLCLHPFLLSAVPLLILMSLFTSSYFIRYPPIQTMVQLPQNATVDHSSNFLLGVKSIKKSQKFLRNMRDIQNIMEDYSRLYDQTLDFILPLTDFSDEKIASNVFLTLLFTLIFDLIFYQFFPWRLILILSGWVIVCSNHPFIHNKLLLSEILAALNRHKIKSCLKGSLAENDLLSPLEILEVEVFEIHHLTPAGEWESWVFSQTPFISSGDESIRPEWPTGSPFLEDVQPPLGWEWAEKKWALDLWSREWVEERMINAVKVETEGESWVYDLQHETGSCGVGINGSKENHCAENQTSLNTWEEMAFSGAEVNPNGEWRRRRWIRTVKRKWLNNFNPVSSESFK